MKIKTNMSKIRHILGIKNIIVVAVVVAILGFGISRISSIFAASNVVSIETAQKAIQEVAMAYYRKGTNIQYDSHRRNDRISPEEITKHNVSYTVCSGFIAMVYKEALGMTVPSTTKMTMNFVREHSAGHDLNYDDYDENNYGEFKGDSGYREIIYFTNDFAGYRNEENHTKNELKDYRKKILDLLQPGDILTTFGSSNDKKETPENKRNQKGHDMLVYKIVKDTNGVAKNAILLDSNGQMAKNNNNLKNGISFTDHTPSIDDADIEFSENFHEGSINTHFLFDDKDSTHSIGDDNYETTDFNTSIVVKSKKFFSILRPTYYLSNPTTYGGKVHDIGCHSQDDTGSYCLTLNSRLLQLPERTNSRIKYPGIQIEKTVSIGDGRNVAPGGNLEYTIVIKNNSNGQYKDIAINENVDTSLVDIVKDKSTSCYTDKQISCIKTINAGKSITITYAVQVKGDLKNIGKTVESTGAVAGIPTATISNKIYKGLTDDQVDLIKKNYYFGKDEEDDKDDAKKLNGIKLIKAVYEGVDDDFANALDDADKLLGYQFDKNAKCEVLIFISYDLLYYMTYI